MVRVTRRPARPGCPPWQRAEGRTVVRELSSYASVGPMSPVKSEPRVRCSASGLPFGEQPGVTLLRFEGASLAGHALRASLQRNAAGYLHAGDRQDMRASLVEEEPEHGDGVGEVHFVIGLPVKQCLICLMFP